MQNEADLSQISHVTIFGVVTEGHYKSLIQLFEEDRDISRFLKIRRDLEIISNWVTFELNEEEFESEGSKVDFIRNFPKTFRTEHDVFPVKFGNYVDEDNNTLINLDDVDESSGGDEMDQQKIFRIPPKQQNLLHLQFEKKGILVWIQEFIKGPTNNLTQRNITQMVDMMKSRFIFILVLFFIWRVFIFIKNYILH